MHVYIFEHVDAYGEVLAYYRTYNDNAGCAVTTRRVASTYALSAHVFASQYALRQPWHDCCNDACRIRTEPLPVACYAQICSEIGLIGTWTDAYTLQSHRYTPSADVCLPTQPEAPVSEHWRGVDVGKVRLDAPSPLQLTPEASCFNCIYKRRFAPKRTAHRSEPSKSSISTATAWKDSRFQTTAGEAHTKGRTSLSAVCAERSSAKGETLEFTAECTHLSLSQ